MQAQSQPDDTEYRDLFISHASEDKDDFVRPLAHALVAEGLQVWFDEFELRIGDSLRQKIDDGLRRSRFGVVVLSPTFFQKHWTQYEMDGLIARQNSGQRTILPIWHRMTRNEIAEHSPSLLDIIALNSATSTTPEIARGIADVVRSQTPQGTNAPSKATLPQQPNHTFGMFYVASVGTNPLPPGQKPQRSGLFPSSNGWISMLTGDEELEYILDGNTLRIRLNWGNQLSGDEIQASMLVESGNPVAITIRPAVGEQIHLPSVVNQSPSNWALGRSNRSGWKTFQVQSYQ